MADQGRSLTQIGGAAAGVVLGCAVLFGVVGMLRNGDTTPEITSGATPTEVAASADPSASAAPAGTPAPDEGAGDGSGEGSTGAPSEGATASATEAPATTPTQAATEAPAGNVTPGNVTIQVLDATGTGTRTAGNKVADRLREAGYNVIVVNGASKTYTDTTVFWSDGQSAAGRQIASEFGFPKSMATPDEVSLSNSVNVHVVVGTDQS